MKISHLLAAAAAAYEKLNSTQTEFKFNFEKQSR